jgi:S-adenosylmethionine:tRNA ribosyltransferase-isomerase
MTATITALPDLPAAAPTATRGLTPDQARMLVARRGGGPFEHRRLRDLPTVLTEGDVLVVNTSKAVPSALPARRGDGTPVRLHLSTRTPDGWWIVEVRQPDGTGSRPFGHAAPGEVFRLPAGALARLLAPLQSSPIPGGVRLWRAQVDLPGEPDVYLTNHGEPVRYTAGGATLAEPAQTVFATVPGSAEPPSAALGFTGGLVTGLIAAGIEIAPVTLHTGVSSTETGEAPHGEWYAVSAVTARRVNAARTAGGRIIAVGTTVTRALETVAGADGRVHPGRGWTEHLVGPATGIRAVDGLLTGWHEPQASHLELVTAVGGAELVGRSYRAAAAAGYLGHEHGDTHLILP